MASDELPRRAWTGTAKAKTDAPRAMRASVSFVAAAETGADANATAESVVFRWARRWESSALCRVRMWVF